jgi:hypothetical protein
MSVDSHFYLHSNDPKFKEIYGARGKLMGLDIRSVERAISWVRYMKEHSNTLPKFETFWVEKETIVKTRKKVTKRIILK